MADGDDVQAFRALGELYHAAITGLVLAVNAQASSALAEELVFRIFRRQQEARFLPGLAKLGLLDEPDAVACAKYHYLSNQLGGVRVEDAVLARSRLDLEARRAQRDRVEGLRLGGQDDAQGRVGLQAMDAEDVATKEARNPDPPSQADRLRQARGPARRVNAPAERLRVREGHEEGPGALYVALDQHRDDAAV